MVEMTAFKNKAPHLLSGRQKQRVAIAGIIAMRPKYIVFDEPTAMLDPQGRREVIQTMQKLNKEEHITIINITHYMEEAVLADRIIRSWIRAISPSQARRAKYLRRLIL